MLASVALFSAATRLRPGKIEIEAENLRRRALGQLKEEMSMAALLPVLVGPRRFRQLFFLVVFASQFLRRKAARRIVDV